MSRLMNWSLISLVVAALVTLLAGSPFLLGVLGRGSFEIPLSSAGAIALVYATAYFAVAGLRQNLNRFSRWEMAGYLTMSGVLMLAEIIALAHFFEPSGAKWGNVLTIVLWAIILFSVSGLVVFVGRWLWGCFTTISP